MILAPNKLLKNAMRFSPTIREMIKVFSDFSIDAFLRNHRGNEQIAKNASKQMVSVGHFSIHKFNHKQNRFIKRLWSSQSVGVDSETRK